MGETYLQQLFIATLPYLTLLNLFSCKPLQTRRLNRFTRNGLNDAVCCQEVPFGGRVNTKLRLRVKTPENLEVWNLHAKFAAKSMHSNNFSMVRDKRKISTDDRYNIGIGESNGDVISTLGHHLAAKTTSGPILKA
jgi:hypothetical protein